MLRSGENLLHEVKLARTWPDTLYAVIARYERDVKLFKDLGFPQAMKTEMPQRRELV